MMDWWPLLLAGYLGGWVASIHFVFRTDTEVEPRAPYGLITYLVSMAIALTWPFVFVSHLIQIIKITRREHR